MNDSIRPLLLRIGQAQVDALFARQEKGPAIDDSEFLPLVEVVLTAFEKSEQSDTVVEELWEHAYAVYDRLDACGRMGTFVRQWTCVTLLGRRPRHEERSRSMCA